MSWEGGGYDRGDIEPDENPRKYVVKRSRWKGKWTVWDTSSQRAVAIRNDRKSAEDYAGKLNFIAVGRQEGRPA